MSAGFIHQSTKIAGLILGLILLSSVDAAVTYKEDTLLRDFGYTIGDVVTRMIVLEIEQPHELQSDQIPAVGKLNRWLELRSINLTDENRGGLTRYDLTLKYQILNSEANQSKIFLPGFELTLVIPERRLPLVFQSLPIRMVRVTEEDPSRSLQVLDLQPPIAPESVSLQTPKLKLFASIAGIFISGLIVAYITIGLPWIKHLQGPFARAYKKLHGLNSQSDKSNHKDGLRCMHEALNETHGRVLLHDDLEEFLQQNPAFNQVSSELARLFTRSRAVFFSDTDEPAGSLDELLQLSRLCRDIERGLL